MSRKSPEMSFHSATVSNMSDQLLREILRELKKTNEELAKLRAAVEDVEQAVYST